MIKQLILMRHAEAEPNFFCEDFDRNLTSHGIEQSKNAGLFLKQHSNKIDKIICSASRRTHQTYQIVKEFVIFKEFELNTKLYNCSSEFLYELIKIQNDQYNTTMIVGHNPSISDLTRMLLSHDKEFEGFYPSTIMILNLTQTKSWIDLPNSIIELKYSYNSFGE